MIEGKPGQPEPTAPQRRWWTSVSARIGIGLAVLAAVLVFISITALQDLTRFKRELGVLADQEIPRITTAAELTGALRSLTGLSGQMIRADSHSQRRLTRAEIDTQILSVRSLSQTLGDLEGIVPFRKLIQAFERTISQLDFVVTDRIDNNRTARARLAQLNELGQQVAAFKRQIAGRPHIHVGDHTLESLIDIAAHMVSQSIYAAQLRQVRSVRTIHRAVMEQFDTLQIDDIHATAVSKMELMVLISRLRKVLAGEDGYFQALLAAENDRGRGLALGYQINLFVAESAKQAQSIFTHVKKRTKTESSRLTERIDAQVRAFAGAVGLSILLVAIVYVYFRNTLTSRLIRLNTAIIDRVRGKATPIDVSGGDDIGDIGRSVNYFIEEIDRRQINLAASERQFRSLVEGAAMAIVILRDRTPVFYNQAFLSLLDITEGRTKEVLAISRARLPDVLYAGPAPTAPNEIRRVKLTTAELKEIWVDYVISDVIWRGKPSVQVAMIDATKDVMAEFALREAKERAEMANSSKNQFLASMSYELRTPLNAVIGFSDAILSGAFGAPATAKQREFIGDINEAGKHLLELVNDILDLSRIEIAGPDLHEEIIDAGELVQSCTRLLRERALKSGLELRTDLPTASPLLSVDPRRIRQILVNLLTNAIKFTGRGGIITLAGFLDDNGDFVYEVADTGVGVKPDDIARVLDPFVQIGDTLTRRHDGAGIGLPLSKKLIEHHGGDLTIHSREGQGTQVRVTIPRNRVHAPASLLDA